MFKKKRKETKEKIGVLVKDVQVRSLKTVYYWDAYKKFSQMLKALFVFRRLAILLVPVIFKEPAFQVMALCTLNFASMIMYTHVQPHDSKARRKIEIFNEFSCTVFTYFLMCQQDFIPSFETRF